MEGKRGGGWDLLSKNILFFKSGINIIIFFPNIKHIFKLLYYFMQL